MENGEMKRIMEVWLTVMASLCYCRFVSSRFSPARLRLFSLLPVFTLFSLLPLRLSAAFPTAVTAFLITWLANFKLLLFAFHLGPLSSLPPLPLPLFLFAAILPIRASPNPSKPRKTTLPLKLNLAAESVAFSVLMAALLDYREILHPKIVLLLYCCLVFLTVDILVAVSNAAVRAAAGWELEPPSNEPYLATSLQDFWGRRWNLMVTKTLRDTVYSPVRAAAEHVVGFRWAALPAVLAAFAVSGLMHELLFYYVTRASPTWEMTGFFALHGVCVVAEFGLKRAAAASGWRLPAVVSVVLTLGFVVATSFWLFFPPLTRGGADAMVIGEFGMFVDFLKRKLTSSFLKFSRRN
ncbi:probable long-chain-alcohol O-fatty-acyltransferase 5 [Diospyros lotus]|uniref:probable long-chain-alcohol O-fatty-acyltransferase 5 n=1 Tax=Diospyros lotus TaxID=55363 RepID=UPI00225BDB7B|nr:probable long-chain-alcohol O-fatty-acyltransferase 5 [Diospyros lotus]